MLVQGLFVLCWWVQLADQDIMEMTPNMVMNEEVWPASVVLIL